MGAKSGSIYVGRHKECVSVINNAHSKSVGCLLLTANNNFIISASHDKTLKRWKIRKSKPRLFSDDELSEQSDFEEKMNGANGSKLLRKTSKSSLRLNTLRSSRSMSSLRLKKATKKKRESRALSEQWSCSVNIADSDFVLYPKAMVYNDDTETLFVGSKTNQIMRFEMKSEEASLLVDGHGAAISTVCSHPKLPLFATGAHDNTIKIWNVATTSCIITYKFRREHGFRKGHKISCGHWSNDGNVIVFGTENTSCIAVFWWDSESMSLQLQEMVHVPPKNKNSQSEPVSYLRFNKDSSLLAAAIADGNMYIYSVSADANGGTAALQQWPVGLPHIAAPINVQFSDDGKMVKALTRDYEVAHWALDSEKLKGRFCATIPDPDEVRWADEPLIAGWDVEGLYQKEWVGTDLNDATITSNRRLIATGDNYG